MQSEGIKLIGFNERLDPAIRSTFMSMDVEIIDGGHGGGHLMSDLLNGEVIYYARDEFDEIKSRVSEDLNGDGFVDEFTNYRMWTASGGVNLTNRVERHTLIPPQECGMLRRQFKRIMASLI